MVESKVCAKCSEDKPLEQFVKSTQRKDGRGSYCYPCDRVRKIASLSKNPVSPEVRRKYVATYKQRHPERVRAQDRKRNLRQKFGITVDDYDRLLLEQDGKCAVCHLPERVMVRGRVKELAVDHNHETGEVRGLLCTKCNTALGLLDDCLSRIDSLRRYLETYLERQYVTT